MNPPVELERLRCRPRKHEAVAIPDGGEIVLETDAGNSLELRLEFAPTAARQFGVKVCRSLLAEEQTLIYYDAADKKLKIDTTKSSLNDSPRTIEAAPFELCVNEPLSLRVFVDKSVVEVFANGGRQAAMRRIYPSRKDSIGVSLFATGGSANVTTIEAWDLSPSNPF
jgi:sucrose-6-phosphate hydrolase SacC (GH32 family)